METMPDEATKVPFTLKVIGTILNTMDAWIYREDGTVNRKLQHYLEFHAPPNPKPVNGVFTNDVVIDAACDVWVRVFTPTTQDDGSVDSEKKLPVILFYHGGGFVGLSAKDKVYDKFCRNIAKSCNAVLVSVNYRRAPEFPFPAAYDDCYKAFDWLRSPDSRTVIPATADLSHCFLLGDSAGGNIVHFMGCRAAQDDLSPIKLRAMVELQPSFGGEELTPAEINVKPPILHLQRCYWSWRAFLPPGANRDHHACNVFGPNSPDISGLSLPPVLVVIGSLDILQDWQSRYVQKLQDLGKEVKVLKYAGGFHCCYIIEVNGLAAKIVADVCDFIRSHCST